MLEYTYRVPGWGMKCWSVYIECMGGKWSDIVYRVQGWETKRHIEILPGPLWRGKNGFSKRLRGHTIVLLLGFFLHILNHCYWVCKHIQVLFSPDCFFKNCEKPLHLFRCLSSQQRLRRQQVRVVSDFFGMCLRSRRLRRLTISENIQLNLLLPLPLVFFFFFILK